MSKPLTYTFNGFEHTMSAEEVEAIERLGPLAHLDPLPYVPLKEAIAAMIKRPGIRWEEAAQVPVKGKPTVFHVEGNCLWRDGIHLIAQRFRCQYKIHPKTCCESCAKRLHNAGMLVLNNVREKERFRKIREANEARAEKRRKEQTSIPYGELALTWGVSVATLKDWKYRRLISGPAGCVWKRCAKPDHWTKQRKTRATVSVSVSPTKIVHKAPLTDYSGRI